MSTIRIKSAFRNLLKSRSYGLLNIAGLAIGIAAATLIFLWVEDEVTFDSSFAKRDDIYQVIETQSFSGRLQTVMVTPGVLAPALKAEVPGIRNSTRYGGGNVESLFSVGEKAIYESGNYADSSFFFIFGIEFLKGKPNHAFDQLHSLVITEAMSRRFFGDADPMGQTLKMENGDLYTITGVVKELPANSSLSFSWLAPFETLLSRYDWMTRWDANGVFTYVELQNNTNKSAVDTKLTSFLATKKAKLDTKLSLFAMKDWRLHNHFTDGHQDGNGQIRYVKLFSLIAGLILVIACINFMNLATARSEQRAKEVGVRKTLGAGRKGLISQFIGEALLMSLIAVAVAIVIVFSLLPAFNTLVGKQLLLGIFNPVHIGGLLSIGLLCGLLAGSYPAFYLSSFNPVYVLKGMKMEATGGASFIRKTLVTTQFAVSIVLIVCTAIIYQQIRHTKDRDLGYNKQNSFYMSLHGKQADHFAATKTALINTGVVENAAMSISPTFHFGWFSGDNYTWQGKDPSNNVSIQIEAATPEYIATMGMKLKEGRDFSPDAQSDFNNVIVNETMADLMGNGSQVGSVIMQISEGDTNPWKMTVVGVVKDFVFGSMYGSKTEPVILICNPAPYRFMTVRLKEGGDTKKSLANVERVMKSLHPEYPFEYKFLDDEFDKLFKAETLVEKLAGVFSGLAILISCLGLFGLAAYTATRRAKEISIRKVMGATAGGLTGMLSFDFLKLVIIACTISFPVAWWTMTEWLSSYEYRTTIHWWVFAGTGAAAISIALLTVSFQTIKAAVANPVRNLRE